ncbi:MAG: peptidase M28, partial [Bacteroidetes bacterium]|nr:peptidase M28 [Bacteroidota bacterium]
MKKLLLILSIFSLQTFAQNINTSDIKANEIKNHIYYLASDNLEGRFTGSNGADSAANYIKNYFQ